MSKVHSPKSFVLSAVAISCLKFLIPILTITGAILCYTAIVYDRLPGDSFITTWVQRVHFPGTAGTMQFFSTVGHSYVMVGLGAIFFGYLFRIGRKYEAWSFGLLVGFTFVSTYLLKELIDRPRPTEDLVRIWSIHGGMSFPSGTVLNSTVVLGAIYFTLFSIPTMSRIIVLARNILVIPIIVIGISRIYLGAHWPSDVLGSYVLGSLFLCLFILSFRKT